MRKRRLPFFLWIPGLVLLLLLVLVCYEHVRGRVALKRYLKQLQAQGKKLTAEDFRVVAQPGNRALDISSAAQDLITGAILPNKYYPPIMKLTPAGRALIGFREDFWLDDKSTNTWSAVALEVETNKATLQEIGKALQAPVLDNQVDLSQGSDGLPRQSPAVKKLAYWFGAAGKVALRAKQPADAASYFSGEIQLPRLLAQDRTMIAEMLRFSQVNLASFDCWEALQFDGWEEAQLAQMQSAWAQQEFATNLLRSLEGERFLVTYEYEKMRQSNNRIATMIYAYNTVLNPNGDGEPVWEKIVSGLPGGKSAVKFIQTQVYCRLWRFAWLDQEELHVMKQLEEWMKLAHAAAQAHSFESIRPDVERRQADGEVAGFYDRLRYPTMNIVPAFMRVPERAMRAETERSLMLCAIALKRFELRHGKPAPSLEALVPEFLSEVPIDYMDGKPVRYRPTKDGGFLLYSVGSDGVDDGGNAGLPEEPKRGRNIWQRKDRVWPAPATAEELEYFRKHPED